jgi:hypothetical protein
VIKLEVRIEASDLADLHEVAAAELRWMPMSAVCRMALGEWIANRKNSAKSTSSVAVPMLNQSAPVGTSPSYVLDLSLDPPKGEEKREKIKSETVNQSAPVGTSRGVHKRARQTDLIDDEAKAAATAFILALNEVKGGRYETECGAFKETVRMVRWHIDNDHRTSDDFVLVARWSWGAWKGGIQEKNCNPDTLLRQSLFGKYLAEARAAAPVNATPEEKARSKAEQQAIWDKMDAESRAEQARIEALCGGFFNK